ncbi:hypothetical protein AB0C28_41740 [Nonomuraea sp. NPDC048892]|uniref:hypothetical protein n=1 Tax=Nonomuraea sp. NPDC048892 TaxID=3154624 RepID=UPI0033CEFE61
MSESLCDCAESPIRDAVIWEWLRLSARNRQLAVLRNAFRPWRITYDRARTGLLWKAEPSWQLTQDEVTAGVRQSVECHNPIDLMAVLTDQAAIIQRLTGPRP